jgi:hypothetical protein
MSLYLKYLKTLLRHRRFVRQECWKRGLYWRGITHDLSKFRPSEFGPYARFFQGEKTAESQAAFDFAWLLHQKRNPHHWQWWLLTQDEDAPIVFEMDEKERLEMLCDWLGAGRAYNPKPDTPGWYAAHKDTMALGPQTREFIESALRDMGEI